MANHPSADKRHRQSLKRRDRNRSAKSAIATSLKATLKACKLGDVEAANKNFLVTTRLLDKAASKGVVHKNNAARRISRLQKRVEATQAQTS
jgi:small subunit ribosomal protein S20